MSVQEALKSLARLKSFSSEHSSLLQKGKVQQPGLGTTRGLGVGPKGSGRTLTFVMPASHWNCAITSYHAPSSQAPRDASEPRAQTEMERPVESRLNETHRAAFSLALHGPPPSELSLKIPPHLIRGEGHAQQT
mmetsp:Transcript_29044/g.47399  ORF Transcript_29044/g.47399 Transcript_29044/m.47399 type:complete len:134 (-) Transcript_29044:392-793(-)